MPGYIHTAWSTFQTVTRAAMMLTESLYDTRNRQDGGQLHGMCALQESLQSGSHIRHVEKEAVVTHRAVELVVYHLLVAIDAESLCDLALLDEGEQGVALHPDDEGRCR